MSTQGGSQRKRIAKSGDEADEHGSWRRMYCGLQRAGATAKVKRSTRRRERRDLERELQRGDA